MNFELRKVETEELVNITAGLAHEIWNECFSSLLTQEQIDYMIDKFQSKEAMKSQIANENYTYYLVCLDGKYVGYTGIKPENGKLFLSKIYLLDSVRGKGLASRVFEFLEKLCAENGYKSIWLTVNKHNSRAVEVYKSRGFEIIREQVVDIGNGFVMDDYVLEKAGGG